MKKAFTLAEVLIALSVIGISAALTIPALIHNYKKAEYSAKLKKFYSLINQALQLSQLENGEISTWSRDDNIYDDEGEFSPEENFNEMTRYWNKYFSPYIKTLKVTKSGNNAMIYLQDGSTINAWNGGCVSFTYDLNGDKKPNSLGKDQYFFHICNKPAEQERYLGKNVIFGPAGLIDLKNRQEALQRCISVPSDCGVLLIKYDNFEFKDDYPHKL